MTDQRRLRRPQARGAASVPEACLGQPPSCPTILLSVAGLTPQIITETLYCLIVQRTPPADIRAVHVLTTQAGAARVRDQLLHPRHGWFHRFCRDFGIPRRRIAFSAENIHVPTGADGVLLDDVRTPEDNLRMADATLELVRNLTRDPAVSLHVSVAGGRKTMGLLLGVAFQLFARSQDRLSHVLVSPADLEGHPDFFYPSPAPTVYGVRGRRIRSDAARLHLAEIPVLLLRDKIRPIGLETLTYSDLIAQGQRDLDRLVVPPPLLLRSRTRALEVAEARVAFTPLEAALYRLFAERRLMCAVSDCGGCPRCSLEAADFDKSEILDQLTGYLEALKARDERARLLAGWRDAAYKRFREVRARINAKIVAALGAGQWATRYTIVSTGRRPDTRYHLPLPPELIHLQ